MFSGISKRVGAMSFVAAALVASVLGTAIPPVGAQTTPIGDLVADPSLVDGSPCDTTGGTTLCSLRAAIAAANDTPNTTVAVLPGVHLLTEGELDITGDGTRILGAGLPPGVGASVISAGGESRVLDINADGVVIDGLTITAGDAGRSDGGGIRIARGSTVTVRGTSLVGNTARDGGGIQNRGSLALEQSTISENTATRKGGGLRNAGDASVENSTFFDNTADQGGGISSPGTTDVTHATIVGNDAGSSAGGGVDRNGGTLTIRYSIIANNLKNGATANRDCSGTPDLVGLNLVSEVQGCNPVGPVIEAQPLITPTPGPNGGPTATMALLEGSPALDAIAIADCTLTVDQRGTSRPTGAGCDLGAFEEAPLAATYALDVDASNYAAIQDTDVAGPEVEVGVVSVPTDAILSELVSRAEDHTSASIAEAALRSVALRSVTLDDLALRSVSPEAAALRSVALRSVDLHDLALRSVALRSVIIDSALRSVALRSVLLSDIALRSVGGWEAFIAGTPELAYLIGVPLQSITLEDILAVLGETAAQDVLGSVTLDDISLDATALRSVALRSVLLAGIALRSVPVPDADGILQDGGTAAHETAWCELLGELCGTDSGQVRSADLLDLDLLAVQLAGGDVDGVPIFDIPLSTALRSVALRSVALRSVLIENSALRSVALRSVALRSVDTGIDYIGAIVDCAAAPEYCSTDGTNEFTLGDVPDSALIGDVGSIAGLPADLIGDLSIGDLILTFVPPDEPSWESLDIEGALLQNISDPLQPTFDYVATVEITGGPAELDFSLLLPAGFAAARAPGDPAATFDGTPVVPTSASLANLEFSVSGAGNGTHTLRVPVRAGLETGSVDSDGDPKFVAFGSVVATGGGDEIAPPEDSVAVNVLASAAVEDGSGATPLSFDDGALNLAHVSREGDVDLYRLDVPEILDGTEARIRLSNIPAGADYDLTFYRPTPTPLRQAPTVELDQLGDFGYDLDPAEDVYPTDVADDVAQDVPEDRGLGDFTVGDTSTRRSNEDEEVATGVLAGGETYYVAVTPFLQSFSPQPYGLRIRVADGVDLPECAASVVLPAGAPSAPSVPAVPSGVNTLYVTNTQWLAAEVGDTAAILDAASETAGVNGVVPMVVPVDAYPGVAARYADWKANRCDIEARNAVVSAIGGVLDDVIAEAGTVDNIVLIGGDGVVPMAAVPDLTAYSNESTFASSALFPDATGELRSNEVSSALGLGYLLTDDPYATDAGIAVNEGDHELFMPDRALGRLVETGSEILGQLLHFSQFDGQLDPTAVPEAPAPLDSFVTGYDFLDDGADAIADALSEVSTVSRLDDSAPLWDRTAFLDVLDDNDYRVLSPNAHYDWESLLPAAPDGAGFFDDGDLVTTSDLTAALIPTNALIFTMGCHAGLSIDDVQIGFTAPDWAQTYAVDAPAAGVDPTTNLYAAHTTYGYGDSDIVAYSERLLELFAEEVAALIDPTVGDSAASVGEALRNAKQDYLAGLLVLTPYDEKILQSLTFYGLPMYRIDGGDAPAEATTTATETEEERPSPVSFGVPNAAGVTPVDIDLTLTEGSSGPANLNFVSTPSGDYFEVDGNTVSAQYRAVQPLVSEPIPPEIGRVGGLLITELTSIAFEDFDPLYLNPLLDSSAIEGRVEVADGSFPASLQRIAPAVGDGPERLNVAAGQFEDGALGGVQRVYSHIAGELYPLTGDATADTPLFQRVIGRVGENEAVVQFEITTDDSASRVYVLFLEGNPGGAAVWRGLDLAPVPGPAGSTAWIGAAPVSTANADVEFFAQAVNDSGVSISTNKVDKFLAEKNVDGEDLQIDLSSPVPTDPTNGYFTADVTASVSYPADPGDQPRQIEISVDAGPFQPAENAQVTVTGDGGHVVLARDEFGGREYVFFVIDGSPPELTTAVFPDTPVANGPVSISLMAADVGQSGVAQLVYTVGEIQTVVDGRSASIEITRDGSTEVSAYAIDTAGNISDLWTRTITIDQTPPVVTVDPVPLAWVNTDVTVTVRASDDAGVAAITIDGSATTFDPAVSPATASTVISAEGVTTVTYDAADAAGNTSVPGTVDVRIDKTAPTVPMFTIGFVDTNGNGINGDAGDQAVATFRCEDALSGVAIDGCTISVDGGESQVASGTDGDGNGTFDLPTGDPGVLDVTVTAVDVAGNTVTTAAVSYTAPYGICLQYDPDQPKNIGANYTIRLTLCDSDGANLSERRITLEAVSIDGEFSPGPNDSGNANRLYEFRYQASSDRYVYNLDTSELGYLSTGEQHTLDFTVTEADGTVSYGVAPFTLR